MSAKLFEYRGHYLVRRRSNGMLVIRWYDPSRRAGGPRGKSTGTRDLEQAKDVMIRFVLEGGRYSHVAPEVMPLAEFLLSFRAKLEEDRPAGLANDRKALLDIAGAMPDATVADLEAPARQLGLVASLRDAGFGDSAIRRKLGTLSRAVSWGVSFRKLQRKPGLLTPRELGLAPDRSREVYFSEEQAAAFWRAIDDEHIAAFFTLGMCTGARRSALCEVTVFDVDRARGLLDLRRFTSPDGRKRHGVLPIPEALSPWLTARKGSLVVGRKVKAIQRGWKATLERARLPAGLTPHAMRHTVASVLAAAGVPDHEIRLWFAERVGKDGYTHRLTHRPDYLAGAAAVLDGFMEEIEIALKSEKDRVAARSLSPETWRVRDSCVPSPKCPGSETRGKSGAGDGIRTHDPNLGKVVLYP